MRSKKLKHYVAIVFFLHSIFIQAQELPELIKNGKDKWDKQDWKRANTARFAFYMDHQMRESIRLMNLARINGPKFSEVYIEPIPDKTKYEESLIKSLNKQDPKGLLRPSFNIFGSAAVHSFFSGITGYEGHKGFNTRMVLFQPFNSGKKTGENCDYGNKKALDITLALLIDRGVPSLGHRYNILESDFSRIGGSRFLHTEYKWNAVFNYTSANWKDLLFHVQPHIQQYGFNIGVSQISSKPMFDVGMAYFANHFQTSNLFMSLNYQMGFKHNTTNALSFYLGSGMNTNVYRNFMLGTKFQTYFNLGKPNLYIQPELSWFGIISFFRKGYLYDVNDLKKSALYKFSYGYNFRVIQGESNLVLRHNFSISRFISLKTRIHRSED